jgi:hypothetical protein
MTLLLRCGAKAVFTRMLLKARAFTPRRASFSFAYLIIFRSAARAARSAPLLIIHARHFTPRRLPSLSLMPFRRHYYAAAFSPSIIFIFTPLAIITTPFRRCFRLFIYSTPPPPFSRCPPCRFIRRHFAAAIRYAADTLSPC